VAVVPSQAHHRRRAGFDAELHVQVLQMLLHRAVAAAQQRADLAVGLAGGPASAALRLRAASSTGRAAPGRAGGGGGGMACSCCCARQRASASEYRRDNGAPTWSSSNCSRSLKSRRLRLSTKLTSVRPSTHTGNATAWSMPTRL